MSASGSESSGKSVTQYRTPISYAPQYVQDSTATAVNQYMNMGPVPLQYGRGQSIDKTIEQLKNHPMWGKPYSPFGGMPPEEWEKVPTEKQAEYEMNAIMSKGLRERVENLEALKESGQQYTGGQTFSMPTRWPMYGSQMISQLYSPTPSHQAAKEESQSFGGGCNSCFVFAEAERDEKLKELRAFRDEKYPKKDIVSSGYNKLSRWLIPLMRKSKTVKFMVKLIMVKPLISFTRWYYGKNHYGVVFMPLAWTWKEIWRTIGKYSKAKEYTWEEFYDIMRST
jgi:hypothetical protein